MTMFKNKKVQDSYDKLLINHTTNESAKIILNSLSILGAKKIEIKDFLDEKSIKRINAFKYPDRLALFLEITNDKSLEWKQMSFAKLALK